MAERLGESVENLRDIYIPTNVEEVADVAMLMVNTVSSAVGLLKKRLNEELYDIEPVFLILGTAFFFILTAWIRKLFTYSVCHPRAGSVHPGVISCLIDSPGSQSRSCGANPPCPLCPFMHDTSALPKTDFPVLGRFDCRSSNVVYLVVCTRCDMLYVGETGGEIRQRFRGHLQSIKEGKGALGEHFRICGMPERAPRSPTRARNLARARNSKVPKQSIDTFEHLLPARTKGIDRCPPMHVMAIQGGFWWSRTRKAAEKRWIEELDTLSPRGLNRNRGTVLRTVWAKLLSSN